jgi:hypothetical protein
LIELVSLHGAEERELLHDPFSQAD